MIKKLKVNLLDGTFYVIDMNVPEVETIIPTEQNEVDYDINYDIDLEKDLLEIYDFNDNTVALFKWSMVKSLYLI